MQNAKIEPRKFDWLGFITRQLPILGLAIWWVVERVQRNEGAGAIVLAVIVSLVLTVLNYLWARPRCCIAIPNAIQWHEESLF